MDLALSIMYFLFVTHLGTFASVLGAVLTVYYSWGANRAARAARLAADQVREQLSKIDIMNDLSEALRLSDDLTRKLDTQSWELVMERSTAIRLKVVPSIQQGRRVYTDETIGRLTELASQMRALGDSAARARQEGARAPNIPRLQKLVSDQQEILTIAISEVKAKIGAQHV